MIRSNNPSHKRRNNNIKQTIFMQRRLGAGCHMRLGDGCHCVKVCRTTRTAFFSFGVCIFSVEFVMHVSLLKSSSKRMLTGRVVVIKCTLIKIVQGGAFV